jgi:guanine nucleotide-binding protein subunit alpha
MKIINLNGFTQDELFTWRATVYRNVVESAQIIVQAISDLGLTYEKPELNVKKHTIFYLFYIYTYRITLG